MLKKTYRPGRGDALPDWYGVAWIDQARLQAVCYPIGLNLVMRLAHHVYLWAMVPGSVRTEAQLKTRIRTLEEQLELARQELRERPFRP